MNKSSWLLNRLQTGSFAILIMCGFGYLAALWAAPPRTSPYLTVDGPPAAPVFGYVIAGKTTLSMSDQIAALRQLYLTQHPIASTSAFAYTVVVLVCLGLIALASIAIGRILVQRDRKARGIVGWSVVLVGAWSLVLLTAAPHFVPCPASYIGPGITCSIASQAAAHWALGLLPMALLLTILPAIAAYSARRMLATPAAPSASRQDAFA
jgi:hypothetical protein